MAWGSLSAPGPIRLVLAALLGLLVEPFNLWLGHFYIVMLEPLPVVAFCAGALFGGAGVVGCATAQIAFRLWHFDAFGWRGGPELAEEQLWRQILGIPLSYALLGLTGYLLFLLGRNIGRGFPTFRSYVALAIGAAGGGLVNALTLSPNGLLELVVHTASNFVSILLVCPLLLLAADSWLRPLMVEVRGERRLASPFPANIALESLQAETATAEMRLDLRWRLSVLAAAIFGLTVLVLQAQQLPNVGIWPLLVYLVPILWAALAHGLRGGLFAACLTGVLYLSGRSFVDRTLLPESPGLYAIGHYVEFVIFALVATFLGAQRETEVGLRKELEGRARQLAELNEMGDLLQASVDVDEAYRVIAQGLHRLFPTTSGFLAVPGRGGLFEPTVTWGEIDGPLFSREDCWALRRGQPHQVLDPAEAPLCRHVDPEHFTPYLCVPLAAQGEILGALHLATRRGTRQTRAGLTPARTALAVAAGKEVALSLANVQLREELREQSIRDPLTGLYNRRYMSESLRRELHRAARYGQPCGVLLLDIDHFKHFNDTFGHDAGDHVLCELARLLMQRARREDIVCRYGGEELVLVLPGAPLVSVTQRAEAIRRQVKELVLIHDGRALGKLSISIGVATFPEHGDGEDEILRAADTALYRAKQDGRDQVAQAEIPE